MLDGTRPTLGSRSSRRGRSSCSPGPGATEAAAGSRPGICTTGGAAVSVVLAGRPLGPGHAQQASIVTRMGIPVCDDPATADLVIDALIGYGLPGYPPRARRRLADWASTRSAPVVSLDGPSGQDLDTGRQAVPCVHADATMTLALPKTGLAGAEAAGRLYLADISVPQLLYQQMAWWYRPCSITADVELNVAPTDKPGAVRR